MNDAAQALQAAGTRAYDIVLLRSSRLCGELDERVGAFLNRQIEGD